MVSRITVSAVEEENFLGGYSETIKIDNDQKTYEKFYVEVEKIHRKATTQRVVYKTSLLNYKLIAMTLEIKLTFIMFMLIWDLAKLLNL